MNLLSKILSTYYIYIITFLVFLSLSFYLYSKLSYQSQIEKNISASSTVRDSNDTSKTSVENQEVESEKKYVIQKGDTLWDLAEKYYGSGFEYPKIIEKNPKKINTFQDGRCCLIYQGNILEL